MGNTERVARLESVLREEIDTVLRCEARDPVLTSVAVVRVELAGARARVWYVNDEHEEAAVNAALDRARGFIRSRVAEALGLKKMPELVFRKDPATREVL
jgi:ribosome-binding factor A